MFSSTIHPLLLYTIQGTVFDTPATFLLDTGAAVSLLRQDIWQRAKAPQHYLRPWTSDSLVGVDGTPLTLHGFTDVTIHLSGIPFYHQGYYCGWINHRSYPWLGFPPGQQMCLRHGQAYFTNL